MFGSIAVLAFVPWLDTARVRSAKYRPMFKWFFWLFVFTCFALGYLGALPGFIEFHVLKGPQAEDHTLYATHTVWADRGAFEDWTRSDAFRRAHSRAGNETGESLYLGHPKFEGFEVIRTEGRSDGAA